MTNAYVWQQELGINPFALGRGALDDLAVESGQFLWLLRKYKATTFYRTARDFVDYVADLQKEGELPDELACRAWNTNDPTMSAWADELETLLGAWYPDETTWARISKLRQEIKAVL